MKILLGLFLAIAGCHLSSVGGQENRTFEVDWDNNRFLKDGQPFRFIAGSFHYFRAHPDSWQRKLRTMRAAGLNAVTTYVEWSLHNPKEGKYVWDGIADLEKFIKLAIEEDLLVILRPGPYICAERDFGGFPYWLLRKHPTINLRTSDVNYLHEIRVWYSQLMPKIVPYLYGNGGPIIMVQVENEYGSYYACDKKYKNWLRDETTSHVREKAALFTNDGPGMLRCGHIDGVLATLDFGATNNLKNFWDRLREVQPKGPLVNSEYYPGWLTHWGENMQRVNIDVIENTLVQMLEDGASVNFYMFYGGTNFGFTAGANDGGPGRYQPDITSYDYDAPMNEAGDPTPKYHRLREIIGRYLPLPDIPVPKPTNKVAYGEITLQASCSILSEQGRRTLSTGIVKAEDPKTFEVLDQYSGLVLYENDLPVMRRDPTVFRVTAIHDRAFVYVENKFIGTLSREVGVTELPISNGRKARVQVLVENQGRLNYGVSLKDFKGITGNVIFGGRVLKNWTMTKFPLESFEDMTKLIEENCTSPNVDGPTIYFGNLTIHGEPQDTYLDTSEWGKGVLFVNGESLGRYWPVVGPQVTLYVPREVLKTGENSIVLLEYQGPPPLGPKVKFTDKPNFGP